MVLLMIAGVPVMVILASTWLWYYVASGRIDIVSFLGTANAGALLEPPLALDDLALRDGAGTAFDVRGEQPTWRILIPGGAACDEQCRQTVYYTRQIHTAMGKYAKRIERVMALPAGADRSFSEDYPKLKLLYTSPSSIQRLTDAASGDGDPAYFVVDPNGWVILSYAADADGKDIMADLKFLLKNSN
jgi:hypothetical protein